MAKYITNSTSIEVSENGDNISFDIVPTSIIASSLTGDENNKAPSVAAVNDALVDTYSTSEVKTNKVWNNSKPIYRQLLIGNRNSQQAETSVSYASIPVDEFTKIDTLVYASGNALIYNQPYYNSASDNYRVYTNLINKVININCGSNFPGYSGKYIIIIEYTKTTD